MLDALVAIHAAGVVHRDLKPSNIYLVPDEDADGPRSRLFFFTSSVGSTWISALERSGTYTGIGWGPQPLGTGSTAVTILRNGMVILYNKMTGATVTARLEKNGSITTTTPSFNPGANFTNIASVGADRFFFYNATTGAGRPGRLTSTGVVTYGTPVTGLLSGTGVQVVGTQSGSVVFYKNASGGQRATCALAENLAFTNVAPVNGIGACTYVASLSENQVLFYNSSTGLAQTGNVATGYVLQYSFPLPVPGAWTSLVGATNGTAFFRDAAGNALYLKVETNGAYSSYSTGSGFGTHWSHVVAE